MSDYLYNGVKLPALPEWDREKYPYAVITLEGFTNCLFISGKEIHESLLGTLSQGWHCRVPYVKYSETGSEWVFTSQSDTVGNLGDGVIVGSKKVLWTNTDLYNEDGTLYLAASDPIPVSAPQHDPLSLFMGWKAGNWVARQRGKV